MADNKKVVDINKKKDEELEKEQAELLDDEFDEEDSEDGKKLPSKPKKEFHPLQWIDRHVVQPVKTWADDVHLKDKAEGAAAAAVVLVGGAFAAGVYLNSKDAAEANVVDVEPDGYREVETPTEEKTE